MKTLEHIPERVFPILGVSPGDDDFDDNFFIIRRRNRGLDEFDGFDRALYEYLFRHYGEFR